MKACTEEDMQEKMGDVWFRLMALEYRLASRPLAIARELEEAGIRPGMTVLDFGCGPGRYTLEAAKLVGKEGMVYGVDVQPLAIKMAERRAIKRGLTNVRTVLSDCATHCASRSVDVVLLYDTLHDVDNQPAVLRELQRVLKPAGRISYKDHTLQGETLLDLMRSNGFFPVEKEIRDAFRTAMMLCLSQAR